MKSPKLGRVPCPGSLSIARSHDSRCLRSFSDVAASGNKGRLGLVAPQRSISTADGKGSTSLTKAARHPKGAHASEAASMPLQTEPYLMNFPPLTEPLGGVICPRHNWATLSYKDSTSLRSETIRPNVHCPLKNELGVLFPTFHFSPKSFEAMKTMGLRLSSLVSDKEAPPLLQTFSFIFAVGGRRV